MATRTGNIYISGIMTYRVEITTANLGFSYYVHQNLKNLKT